MTNQELACRLVESLALIRESDAIKLELSAADQKLLDRIDNWGKTESKP
jgi:hypothetical protein